MSNGKFGKKAIPFRTVMETWEDTGIVEVEMTRDPNTGGQSGVLVGNRSVTEEGIG